jgi:hypothetical protein
MIFMLSGMNFQTTIQLESSHQNLGLIMQQLQPHFLHVVKIPKHQISTKKSVTNLNDNNPDADNSDYNGGGEDDDASRGGEDMVIPVRHPSHIIIHETNRSQGWTQTPSPCHSPSITTPSIMQPQPIKQTTKHSGGCDLGLVKATSTQKKKTLLKDGVKKTAVDTFNDNWEQETTRLINKSKMQHTEKMARIQNKQLKLQLNLIKAQSEATALVRASSPAVASAMSLSSQQPYPSHNY